MMSKWQVQFVAGVVVLVFAIGITFDGGKLESDWLQFYGTQSALLSCSCGCGTSGSGTGGCAAIGRGASRDPGGTWQGT